MSGKRLRDHGGGLDAAIKRFGGERISWIDLSTGINPHPFPLPRFSSSSWQSLPDTQAEAALQSAARRFWHVPPEADVLAAAGASAIIAALPSLFPHGRVFIPHPTYNEHAAAFRAAGWDIARDDDASATARVIVNPNNPDGRLWPLESLPCPDAELTVVDESFCDVLPERSLIDQTTRPGWCVLKSFGKFWGLAGLRLGFIIAEKHLIDLLRDRLGPWAVSGPALEAGAAALNDPNWATETRVRLAEDSKRLDAMMQRAGASVVGGTTLFRLYDVGDAESWQTRLAERQIWSRAFPYNEKWLRLGLPHALHWPRLAAALA